MISFFYDSFLLILFFLLPGVFLGVVYDIFRILRVGRSGNIVLNGQFYEKIRPRGIRLPSNAFLRKTKELLQTGNTILIFMEDFCFWLITAIVEILLFYHTNGGEIRFYCLLSTVLGFFLYQISIGRLTVVCAKRIYYVAGCFLYWTVFPFIWTGKRLVALFVGIFMRFYKKCQLKKARKASERLKISVFHGADVGFSVYQGKEYQHEKEDAYFC